MGFKYPSHWQELADLAFDPSLIDHDHHGFSQPFTDRQEDRDRYLEDYLDALPTVVTKASSVHASVNQSVPNNTAINLTLDVVDYDDLGVWDVASSTYIIKQTGLYFIAGSVFWNTNSAGTRVMSFQKNGTLQLFNLTGPPATAVGDATSQAGSTFAKLAKGDTIALQAYQSSGGALNVNATAGTPLLSLARLG